MRVVVSATLYIGLALSALCAAGATAMARRPAPGPTPRLHLTMTYDGDPAVCRPVQKLVSRAINRYAGTSDIYHADANQIFSSHFTKYRPPQIVVPKADIPGADKPFNPNSGMQQEAFRLRANEGAVGDGILFIMHDYWHGFMYANMYVLKKGAAIPSAGDEPDPGDIIFALGKRKYSGKRMPYLLENMLNFSKFSYLRGFSKVKIFNMKGTEDLFLDRIYTASPFFIKNIRKTFLFFGAPRYGTSIVLQIDSFGVVADVCYFHST
jgi:hypothetical protein